MKNMKKLKEKHGINRKGKETFRGKKREKTPSR